MKHLSLLVVMFGALCLAAPALAAETETIPPEIGLVSPATFTVNHLTTISADVTAHAGLNGCFLYLNDKKIDRMTVRDGHASYQYVFSTPETRYVHIRCEDATGAIGMSATSAMLATASDLTLNHLPLGFSDGQLVQPTCLPGDWQGEHCANIYLIRDGKRHAFQSDIAFRSWYPASSNILSVSIAALSAIPLGESVSVNPQAAGIRFQSQSYLYRIANPGHLKRVSSNDAPTMIDVLSDAFYAQFIIDSPMRDSAGIAA